MNCLPAALLLSTRACCSSSHSPLSSNDLDGCHSRRAPHAAIDDQHRMLHHRIGDKGRGAQDWACSSCQVALITTHNTKKTLAFARKHAPARAIVWVLDNVLGK